MAHKVLIPQDIAQEGKSYLQERGYEIRMGSGTSVEILKREIEDCDGVLLRMAKFPGEVLRAGRKLKVIARHGTGVDNVDLKAAAELGILVTNAPESNASSVAEHTLALILALSKNLILRNREMTGGNFEIRNQAMGVDVENKVLGIVGLGRIGSRVARKAKLGLDMRVVGYDPYLPTEKLPAEVERMVGFEELLQTSDFVSLHMPASDETVGIIGRKELELMKPSAFLINAARGELLRESDLIEALKSRRIAGAGLDVFQDEPPHSDSALFGLDNVVLSPHCASLTHECSIRMAVHAAMGIDEVLSGRPVTWLVDNPHTKEKPRGG